MDIYKSLLASAERKKKQLAILLDPDKINAAEAKQVAEAGKEAKADYFFVGGSLLTEDNLSQCISALKEYSKIPVIIFPGSMLQINRQADAILFLSVISGRNPDMLIGKHVISAPYLRASGLEVISTGYMIVESGTPTAVSYMSGTTPIPHDKDDIALCTAMAGELLGMKLIFMDGGSGAQTPVSASMIRAVKKNISVPLVVGGGIKTPEKAIENCEAGADVIVIGNSVEKDISIIREMAKAIHSV